MRFIILHFWPHMPKSTQFPFIISDIWLLAKNQVAIVLVYAGNAVDNITARFQPQCSGMLGSGKYLPELHGVPIGINILELNIASDADAVTR